MSFFLTEVALLKDAYNKSTIENITRIFSASLSEEEADSAETNEVSGSVKEIDILEGKIHHLQFEKTGIQNVLKNLGNTHRRPRDGYFEVATPPPDKFYIG
jgi:hypothetical protein